MMKYQRIFPSIFSILLLLIFAINVKSNDVNNNNNNNYNLIGCSMKDVMTCVVQLKSYNVPIDTNMMNVVFNVSSEAKLVHVCRAYNNAMPCFKQRLATCANEKQRIRLAEVNRLLLFICAPFSLQRQKTLLKVGKCIGEVLNHPVEQNCSSTKHRFGHKLRLCRDNCESNDVICQMRVRMSELAVCSVIAIEKECGRQAADFYSYMQTAIIAEEFPIQCKYDFAAEKIRRILSSQEFLNEEALLSPSTTKTPPSQFVVQELILPMQESYQKSKESSHQRASSESGTGSKISSSYNYTKKALKIFQNERKKLAPINNKISEENDAFDSEEGEEDVLKKEKTKAIRTRNFSKLFSPSKFAEVNLKKYQPPENTVIVQLFPSKEIFENKTTSKEKLSAASSNEQLPAFLQGARPIPDSSMGRSIILPKTTYLSKENASSKESSKKEAKSFEIENGVTSTLAGVRESYTPKIEKNSETTTPSTLLTSSTTTSSQSSISSTTSSSTTSSPPPPIIITFTETFPITPSPPLFSNVIDETPSNKFMPWYFNSLNRQPNTSMQTENPVFPYFNPRSINSMPSHSPVIDPYYNAQPINSFDSNKFAANFVSRINSSPQFMGYMSTTSTPSTSDDIAKLLNMPDFKEKADTILSTAIDVLKPHNKYQQPFADVPDNSGFHQQQHQQHFPQTNQNKNASGALSELMETIKKISPTVIDNIREKLNSLGHN